MYLRTRNLWVSAMAHIFNDWILFGGVLVLTALTAARG
jgi:membrane protease YdiL (CAAX protease family)